MARKGNTSFPLLLASFNEGDGQTLSGTAEDHAVNSTVVNPIDQQLNSTWRTRFHWKDNDVRVDAHRTVEQDRLYEVVIEGTSGSPQVLSGAVQRLVGAGTQGVYIGFLGAPRCV